jgi:DNA-binding transcriptional regulator PaaX
MLSSKKWSGHGKGSFFATFERQITNNQGATGSRTVVELVEILHKQESRNLADTKKQTF